MTAQKPPQVQSSDQFQDSHANGMPSERLQCMPSITGANQLFQLSTRSLYGNEAEFYRRSDQRGMSLGHTSSLGDQYDTNSQLSRNNSPQSDTDKSAPPRKRVPVAVCLSSLIFHRPALTRQNLYSVDDVGSGRSSAVVMRVAVEDAPIAGTQASQAVNS
jgi:hypothetical protein